jgi:hypothetical protein
MDRRQVEQWLANYRITNYIINKDLTVDVDGNVAIAVCQLQEIPVKFGKVTGMFDCSNNILTTLKNCPDYTGSTFVCLSNKLTSLQGCPSYVGGNFSCSRNFNLTSLQGCPKYVGHDFYCYYNKLTSVKELLEIHISRNIFVDDDMKQTPEYKLLMKLRQL